MWIREQITSNMTVLMSIILAYTSLKARVGETFLYSPTTRALLRKWDKGSTVTQVWKCFPEDMM